MLKKTLRLALLLLISICFGEDILETSKQSRDVPRELNYQGYLTDTIGVPITDDLDMNFKIFDAESGGNELWSESWHDVPVEQGIFSILLGYQTSIPDSVFGDFTNTWLELTLEGPQTLTPRTRITSVGYAYTSTYADTAEYSRIGAADNDWTISGNVMYPSADYGLSMRSGNVMYGTNNGTHVNFGVACTTGANGQNNEFCTVSGGEYNAAKGSYATICGGYNNVVSGIRATIGGGYENIVSGNYATMSGGYENTVSGIIATVGGGQLNIASGYGAIIGGGYENTASSNYTVVSGGVQNYVDNYYATVGGGYADTVTGRFGGILSGYSNLAGDAYEDTAATVVGGWNNSATDKYAFVGGGYGNTASGLRATICGGYYNTASDICAIVGGGSYNTSSTGYSTVGGGYNNTAAGFNFTTVSGGRDNEATGVLATVSGGYANTAAGSYATVAGGRSDTVKAAYGGILSGYNNLAGDATADTAAVIAGGYNNKVTGKFSSISGGRDNSVASNYSSIIGGYADSIVANADYSCLFGINANLTQDSTFMIDIPHIWFGNEATGYEFPRQRGADGQVLVVNSSGQLSWGLASSDNNWSFRITDGADTTLQTGSRWGLARADNVLYGNADSTHVNFGVACTTGASGQNFKYCTVVGGLHNTASSHYATVGGGRTNVASNYYATVAGGWNNIATDEYAFIGGGCDNTASEFSATVAGGYYNLASATSSTVSGGSSDSATGNYSTIGGGYSNAANNGFTTIAGGDDNTASGYGSTVGGGGINLVSGDYATVGGGYADTARYQCSTVGGGYSNVADSTYATIAGGYNNTASGLGSTIGGGGDNISDGLYTIVGGGAINISYGTYSTISGGYSNVTNGNYATIPGGYDNTASGNMSFAAGNRANAVHKGCFVWADSSSGSTFSSTQANQFRIRSTGGIDLTGNVTIRSITSGNVVVELGEGLDYAEGFDVLDKDRISPGMVLSIDSDHAGKLRMSASPYDTKVAGIAAGANGLGSGIQLGSGRFDCNVALAGRVYCNVDATKAGVEPGDLLTTSATPGYAMKVTDYGRAQGAILGKAMQKLEKGMTGQILVLVTLQ